MALNSVTVTITMKPYPDKPVTWRSDIIASTLIVAVSPLTSTWCTPLIAFMKWLRTASSVVWRKTTTRSRVTSQKPSQKFAWIVGHFAPKKC